MRKNYKQPKMDVVVVTQQQIICASGSGWAEMSGYGGNTGGGFIQTEP